tara:strand:- start:106 stop:261 length:156 start_codon:yes stop_codon:yes gene_type:complete
MINKIKNFFKNLFKPERQDPHLVLYEEVKPTHCPGHLYFRKSCLACQEIIK